MLIKAPESAKLPSFDLRCTWLLSQLFLQKLSATLETNEFSEWLNASCSGYIRIKQTFRKQVKTQNAFGVALPFCLFALATLLTSFWTSTRSACLWQGLKMSFAAAGIFTFPSRLLCKISSRTKQWILPGRKVSSGKPRVHLQAAVVAHPIASLISKTKPLPKSNGFNFQRRIPCRPSVSDFNRFLTPWHHWLQQDPTEPYWALLKTERLDAVPNLQRLHRIGSKFRTAFQKKKCEKK